MTVSFIIATTGRDTLQRTVDSIEFRPGDELLLVGQDIGQLLAITPKNQNGAIMVHLPCPVGGDWGHSERNFATPLAQGDYLSFMDDDDIYLPGHRLAMEHAMQTRRPTIFKMRLRHMGGVVLWQDQVFKCGNMGTPCFFLPNDPSKLSKWPPHYGGDFTFIDTCKWEKSEYVWNDFIIGDIRP